MSPGSIGYIVMACVFGGALLGMLLRSRLPDHHLSADSKDVIKLAVGLTATMSALVLALLIASAKSSYDAQRNEVTQIAANLLLLDRILAHYGPETKDVREMLRGSAVSIMIQIWPDQRGTEPVELSSAKGDVLFDKIMDFSPQNETQRELKAQAEKMSIDMAQTRLLLFEQGGSSIPMPFLVLLIFWVTIIFLSFGLFAPRNLTVVVALLLCALSVSGAIFLILELDKPFEGLLRISHTPMLKAIDRLDR